MYDPFHNSVISIGCECFLCAGITLAAVSLHLSYVYLVVSRSGTFVVFLLDMMAFGGGPRWAPLGALSLWGTQGLLALSLSPREPLQVQVTPGGRGRRGPPGGSRVAGGRKYDH